MIELGPLGILIFGELLFVLIGLSALLIFRELQQKARDRRAAAKLIATVKADNGKRKDAMGRILQERYAYEDEQLKKTVRNLDRKEKLLYQALINLYLKRDTVALQQFHIDVDRLTEDYRTLEVPTFLGTNEDGEGSAEVLRLQQENDRLAEELRITMDAMGRMLNEYSSMFAGTSDNDLDKDKMQEQFQVKDQKQDDVADSVEVAEVKQTDPAVEIEPESEESVATDEVDMIAATDELLLAQEPADEDHLTGWPAMPEDAADGLEQLASDELNAATEIDESASETQVIAPDQQANSQLKGKPDKQTLSR